MHELTFNLSDSRDQQLCGGKAFNLSKMIGQGFNVPAGFVISANCPNVIDKKLKEILLIKFDGLNSDVVAVRSSALNEDGNQAAWAGQLDSFLNCTKETFIGCIEKCWDSANSQRAQSYAKQHGLSPGKLSVIVQSMIQSEVSGVGFSIHPVNNDHTVVVVEAVFGLGEAMVSGLVTPDMYVIQKSNLNISEKVISDQEKKLALVGQGDNEWINTDQSSGRSKLSNLQIIELTKIMIDLELYFNYPVDVEWALYDGKFYILQCRPVTT